MSFNSCCSLFLGYYTHLVDAKAVKAVVDAEIVAFHSLERTTELMQDFMENIAVKELSFDARLELYYINYCGCC